MSDLTQNSSPPADDLAPPDDFGAEVMAQFAKREFGSGGAAPLDGGAVPFGEWPGGATVDASQDIKRLDAAAIIGTEPANDDGGASPVPPSGATVEAQEDAAGGSGPAATGESADASGVQTDASAPTEGASPQDIIDAMRQDAGEAATDEATSTEATADEQTTEPPATGGYVWQNGDNPIEFTDEQVQQALIVSAWATQLPDQTRTQFAAIEAGQAVAIPRSDYDAFQAWQQSQTKATRDADLANLDADPEVLKVISDLRDEVATLRAGDSPASIQNNQPDPTAQVHSNLDATAQRMDQAAASYAQTKGLSQPELEALYIEAVNENIIPALAKSMAITNPATGAVIQPADPGAVIEKALDFALVRNPSLHSAVIQRQAAGANGTSPSTTPAPADAVTAKKARASSVASAPSAAVTPTPRSAAARTPQETVAAMAEELAVAMSVSG